MEIAMQGYVNKFVANWPAGQPGVLLAQTQLAAAVKEAWSRPRGYRITQHGDPVRARALWERSRAIYRRSRMTTESLDVTIGVLATDVAPRSRARLLSVPRRV